MSACFESLYIRVLLLRRSFDRFFARYFGFFDKPSYNAAPQIRSRRDFLKLVGVGAGGLVIGKIAGDKLLSSFGEKGYEVGNTKGFKVVEKDDKLVFFNRKGTKLFTLSDDGEMTIGDD